MWEALKRARVPRGESQLAAAKGCGQPLLAVWWPRAEGVLWGGGAGEEKVEAALGKVQAPSCTGDQVGSWAHKPTTLQRRAPGLLYGW